MKKSLLIIMLSLLFLSACGQNMTKIEKSDDKTNDGIVAVEKKEEQKSTKIEEKKNTFDVDSIISQLEIKEYELFNDYWNYHFVELTNNSEQVIDVDLNVLYYNENDELISAESMSEEVIEPGFAVLMYSMPDEQWAKTEISIDVTEPKYYKPVQSDISLNVTPAKEKLVVQATNNGEEAASFVEVSALFFVDSEVVDFDRRYFTDNDSEIKPGKTISNNLEIYKDFNGYKCYVTGRRK